MRLNINRLINAESSLQGFDLISDKVILCYWYIGYNYYLSYVLARSMVLPKSLSRSRYPQCSATQRKSPSLDFQYRNSFNLNNGLFEFILLLCTLFEKRMIQFMQCILTFEPFWVVKTLQVNFSSDSTCVQCWRAPNRMKQLSNAQDSFRLPTVSVID